MPRVFDKVFTAAVLASGLLTTNGQVSQLNRHPPTHSTYHAPHLNASEYRFLTNQTKAHVVESLPDVHYDLGEMYSGFLPVCENASFFYIFQPKIGEPSDDITIWLSGGPGCSSMQGFLQENGRFTWSPGTYKPVVNEYSWVNLTNMLWVDQPVGTGFSAGMPTATNEDDVAADFITFFKQFQALYNVKNFRIFLSGESYAGFYVPYISAAMLDQNDTEYFDVSGALMYDACIGQWDYIQAELPAYPFVQQHSELFNFNQSFMADLETTYEQCGYRGYFDKYFTYPAAEVQPPRYMNYSQCDIYNMIYDEAYNPNPCWSPSKISQTCPLLWDVLGFPTDLAYEPAPTTYFNRTDVKKALHVPEYIEWELCASESVFVGPNPGPEQAYDVSPNPTEHVLPRVIEATNRVLIANGDWDYLIITNGTLLAIQNMTWNGELGFHSRPTTPIHIDMPDLQYSAIFNSQEGYGDFDGPQGMMGVQHHERGLMFAETFQAGHRHSQDQGRVSYRHVEWLLGHRDHL
ncbi:Peptidase S10 serine carboxypeptidase [Penicillium angulare]|uniref:Carboxypeptidase n=1 Tax=Penicillium angulare TaxID=116970 RepID=A0A9W9FAX9_9EURO|nr:Peptidase S10 serine carboxypeptidase [Penicillium angulare]